MPQKGYWIAHVDVNDPEAYKAYVAANAVPFKKYGARFIIRAGAARTVEGASRARMWVWNFRATRRPWPATVRPNTSTPKLCAKAGRKPTSSCSKAMTARSPATGEGGSIVALISRGYTARNR
jgi:uncharacterized protein (DUF1330 family)